MRVFCTWNLVLILDSKGFIYFISLFIALHPSNDPSGSLVRLDFQKLSWWALQWLSTEQRALNRKVAKKCGFHDWWQSHCTWGHAHFCHHGAVTGSHSPVSQIWTVDGIWPWVTMGPPWASGSACDHFRRKVLKNLNTIWSSESSWLY